MADEAVIIAGALDSKELERSIDNIINTISSKSEHMAEPFTNAIGKMEQAMKNFAITQKVSASTMKDAWREMSASFDAMVAAQSASNGGGNGSGNAHATNTIGALEQEIAKIKQERKEMELNSNELRTQNALLERRKNLYKEQTTSPATKRLDNAMQMSTNKLDEAQKKLRLLEILQRRYAGTTELSVSQQQRLARTIQQTKNQIDKIKPKSLREVLGMDANSIDQITAKMRALKNVQIDPKNAAEVKRVGDAYADLKRKQAQLMGQNIQMTHSNNYLAQSFGYIRNRIVYALTLGAITSFTKQIYEIRGQYELLERSLGVLVNSFERGSQIFNELNEMAIKSPFTLIELGTAAKQLTAYNFSANEVVDTTRRLADISAALGVPMERLTYNLGQIRAQTVLTARDARDFANAGLPIIASLADHFTELEGKVVTTGDVYDRMSKKMVSYSDVMAVLNKITDEGGKFFDFQAKQAETLKVQMANLNLAWNNMLNDIGKANQGLLALPVSGLKSLLQNWQSIDRVLKSIIITFGLWKALQVVAIRNQWAWASATGATAKQMGFLANATKGLFASMKALFLNPWTWVFVGIQAIVDLTHQFLNARQEMHELNEEIRNNAKEASESMLNYLNNKGNKSTFELAKQNKLTAEQGDKAWESLKQQIEQSALSANDLITELLAIDDVNKRVRVGFDYAERIQKAQAALQDLKEDSIKVNQDYTFLGIGEEGLVTDLQDYTNEILKFKGTYKELQDLLFTNKGTNTDIKISFLEFDKELDETAESINNFIRAYNITDPLQIKEILERVRSQIKAKNPEIKGEMAKIFDISLDQKMSELTNGAVDRNASLWNMFMERLKNNSSSAFQDINDDWIKNNKKLSKEQKAAIDANLKYFKDSMPYAYDAVANMVKDASKLRIHIGVTFGRGQSTDFQKEVQKRMAQHPILDYGNFAPTANDDLNSWVKTQQEAIKSLGEENKRYALDNTQWSKEKIAANDREIQQHKNLLDLFHQQYAEEKKGRKGGGRKGGGRKPEDVVAEALKQELQLIHEMQSNYDKLRKSGVSNMDAIDIASKGYEATIIRINKVLSKFGIDKFNAANFAGKDVRSLLQSLEEQRQALLASGKVKTSSLQALDVEIQKLTVEAKTYDMKKVTDGLNSELGKIKDEYELAIELDANPELGSIFADYMGIDLNELPKNAEEATKKAQQYIDKILRENKSKEKIDITSLMDKDAFDKWIKSSDHSMDDELVKIVDNYRQTLHKMQVDESKKQMQEWDKLLEKYAEYEYKVTQIQKEAERERETARKKGASQEILDAINERERQELAKLSFEEFQKSPEWIVATGDLANMSKSAIGMLIEQLEKYKRSAKNLSPKQIKQLNSALSKLYKEQRKNNPFKAISNMLDEVKERMSTFDEDIKKTQEEIDNLTKKKKVSIVEGITDGETDNRLKKAIKRLEELKKAREKTGKVDASSWVSSINETISCVQSAIGVFDDLAKAIGGVNNSDLDKVFSVVDKAGQGAAIGAQAGGGWGALIGGVAGAATGIITTFADQWSGNAGITEKINSSERAVKRLELAYIDLEHAVKQSFGMATIGANMEAKANKELQLLELKRQLALERSRDSKHRDDDKIIDLQKQIKELEYDIADTVDDIVNNLLGISSVGDAVENMIGGIIESLRSGEDAMVGFNESVDEMIANMLKKFLATKILAPMFENVWNEINDEIQSRTKNEADALAKAQAEAVRTKGLDYDDYYGWIHPNLYDNSSGVYEWVKRYLKEEGIDIRQAVSNSRLGDESAKQALENFVKWVMTKEKDDAEKATKQAQKELDKASMPTEDDLMDFANNARELSPQMEEYIEYIKQLIERLGLMKSGDGKTLSNLQQGIQGITEDTAGALEAYMNGVSQQVYYHSSLLEQIRDSVVGLDLDVSLGVQSQMLLQLQNSYQTQQAIKQILEGVLTPSGRAFSVELLS